MDALLMVAKWVNEAPTIDAVPVVYGRWQKRGNEKICSACKFIYYSNNDDFNYCPNCGAKMRKGASE
jgi:rRNA maturation endonuclease Nob1